MSPVPLLFIEPRKHALAVPIEDDLTTKVAMMLRQSHIVMSYMGFHECMCGAISSCHDYVVADRTGQNYVKLNSLAVHYIARHRREVPPAEIEALRQFDFAFRVTRRELEGESALRG